MARDFPYELLNLFRTIEVVEQRETHVLRVNAITARFTRPRRTTLISKPAWPAARCATVCYLVFYDLSLRLR